MPKFQFTMWEEAKYNVTFVADSLEDAKKKLEDCVDVDELEESEKYFRKGNENILIETLEEIEGETE